MGCEGHRRRGAFLVLALLLLAGPAQARRNGFHAAALDELSANFDFLVGADFERHQRYGVDEDMRTAQKLILGQRLGVASAGSFIHPRFWYWRAMADVLFIEDIVRGDLAGVRSDFGDKPSYDAERFAVSPEFDVRFDFLREHPVSISMYGQRKTTPIRREFQSNTWLTTWAAGSSLRWRNGVFPIVVHYDYLRGEGERREFRSGDDSHQIFLSGRNIHERSVTTLEHRTVFYDNRFYPEESYDYHQSELRNVLFLNGSRDHRLESVLRFLHREGSLVVQDELRLSELVLFHLLPSLRLRAQGQAAWRRSHDLDMFVPSAWVELQHQLWESLTSTVLGRVTYELAEDWDRITGVLSGSVVYRKRLGPVTMSHSYQILGSWTRNGMGSQRLTVVDEPVVLRGEIPVSLGFDEVDPTSVEVLDATGAIRYHRGQDFDLDVVEDTTYIFRMTGGDIPDGATVLVSFAYVAKFDHDSSMLDQHYRARFETNRWDFLKAYAQYQYRDVRVYADYTPLRPLTYHEVGTGVGGGAYGLHASVDYAYAHAAHFSLHQVGAGLSYVVPLTKTFRPVIGVRNTYLDYDRAGEDRNVLSAYTDARFPIWGTLSGGWRFSYQWEEGGVNSGHFLRGTARLEMTYRKLLFWLEYGTGVECREYEYYDRHSITLNVRRFF